MWKKTANNRDGSRWATTGGAVESHTLRMKLMGRDGRGALVLCALALGALCAIACRIAAGATLGYYLGPVVFAAMVVPLLAEGAPAFAIALGGAVATAFSAGVFIVWLVNGPATLHEACLSGMVLLGVAWLGASFTALFTMTLRSARLGGALAVVILLLWLTCPIWLSMSLADPAWARWVSPITSLHPLLAINGIIPMQGIWTQQRVMYQLTALGQDVNYGLPQSPWPSALFHLLTGSAAFGLCWASAKISANRAAVH